MNERQQMPLLDKDERIKSFEEVALGYTEEQWAAYCEFDRERTRKLLRGEGK